MGADGHYTAQADQVVTQPLASGIMIRSLVEPAENYPVAKKSGGTSYGARRKIQIARTTRNNFNQNSTSGS